MLGNLLKHLSVVMLKLLRKTKTGLDYIVVKLSM